MPPIAITFHSRPPPIPHGRLPSHPKTSLSGTRPKKGKEGYMYFSFDKQPKSSLSTDRTGGTNSGHGNTVNGISTSDSGTTPSPPPPTTLVAPEVKKSKRGKPVFVHPPPENGKVFTLTPQLQPIVDRCFHSPSTTTIESSTSTPSSLSPPLSKKPNVRPKTPVQLYHPYSRLGDTRNDRSSVPSPKEIIRAEKMEIEKIRAKEESAAAARAAAALKRKKGSKNRGGSKSVSARSTSPKNNKSDDEKGEDDDEKDKDVSIPLNHNPLPPRIGLKRTRSTGLGISTGPSLYGVAGPAVSSPLRSVTLAGGGGDEEDGEGHARKRSRLGETDDGSRRRATTGSPTDRTTVRLPSLHSTDEPRTEPIPQGETFIRHPALPTSSAIVYEEMDGVPHNAKKRRASAGVGSIDVSEAMRRIASAGGIAKGLPGSLLESVGNRSRREVTVPARLRDYEMKAAV